MISPDSTEIVPLQKAIRLQRLREGKGERRVALSRQPIDTADRTQSLPLSWAQQRLWFLDQIDRAAGGAYHMASALHLGGALDRAALQRTLDRVVARHENLRTTFVTVDGTPRQNFAPDGVGFWLVDEDLGDVTPEARALAYRRRARWSRGLRSTCRRGR